MDSRPPRSPTSVSKSLGQRLQPLPVADAPRQGLDLEPVCAQAGRSGYCRPRVPAKRNGDLGDDAQLPAVLAQVEGPDVHAVNQQPAALELVEAGDQLGDRRLAGAGVADEGQVLARAGCGGRSPPAPAR